MIRFFAIFLLFCLANYCLSQDYEYQDSISGHQACVTFSSINDGHPNAANKPFFQSTLGYAIDDSPALNFCVANTFASDGFFRKSLFSINFLNAIYRDDKVHLVESIGSSWQHTWLYENGNKPTISSLISVQHPYGELDSNTELQTTLIVVKNIGNKGVAFFNAFLNLPANSSLNSSFLVGYKFFVSEKTNLFTDVIYDLDDLLSLEVSWEINLPNGSVISPGLSYQIDRNNKSNAFGVGLVMLYQTK